MMKDYGVISIFISQSSFMPDKGWTNRASSLLGLNITSYIYILFKEYDDPYELIARFSFTKTTSTGGVEQTNCSSFVVLKHLYYTPWFMNSKVLIDRKCYRIQNLYLVSMNLA